MIAKCAMTDHTLEALIYLWTRDSNMDVSPETEEYIKGHLRAMSQEPHLFSDALRIDMSRRIVREA